MATDMGGFAQAGGPYLVDRFGRLLSGQPQLEVSQYFRRDTVTFDGVASGFTFTTPVDTESVQVVVRSGATTRTILKNEMTFTGLNMSIGYVPSSGDVAEVSYSARAHAGATVLNTVPQTWNASDKATEVILSGMDHTMYCSISSWRCVRGSLGRSSGKLYFEVKRSAKNTDGTVGAGLANSTCTLTAYPGSTADAWAHLSDGYKAHSGYSLYGSAFDTLNDVLMIAIDFTSGKMWFGCNGTWMASGDPVAGTNPTFTGVSGTLYPIGGAKGGGSTDALTLYTIAFAYSPPAGYAGWGV